MNWALATTQVRLGDIGGALKTLDSMDFPSDRAIGLVIIALEKEKPGDLESGNDLMARAVSAISELDDNFWKGFVFQTVGISLVKKGKMARARENFQRAENYYLMVETEKERTRGFLNLAQKLTEQVNSLKDLKDADAAEEILKKFERGKDNLPLTRAYLPPEDGKNFSGMDTVLLFERESKRILALSYIARNFTAAGLEDKAFLLASIWDEPL
ncbi:MAG: hypothetical protein IIC81_09325, partial [Chloroflexi bacterium]|nr:hypothetical protein [Chloroflexota bacterium]